MQDKAFFVLTRAQIEHEDRLLDHRLTWLLTLQGFLFGAYGFSLSAASTAAASGLSANKEAAANLVRVLKEIDHVRTGLALMGLSSATLLFVGIIAATKSMNDLVVAWNKRPKSAVDFPQIIGAGFGSIHIGLIPTYLLPLTFALAWLWLRSELRYYVVSVIVISMVIVVLAYLLALAIDRNRNSIVGG